MENTLFHRVHEALVFLLAGLGVSIAPNAFIGGIFLAVGGAWIFHVWTPHRQEKEAIPLIVTAIIFATVAAMINSIWLPSVPVQLSMFLVGFLAKPVVQKLVKRSGNIADKILDRAIGEKGKDD